MSDLVRSIDASLSTDCPAVAARPVAERIVAASTTLGEGMSIRRALPTRLRRMVGAWCFLDHFGPLAIRGTRGLRVAPHPHIGLQTVTWLLQGDILHRDSLGNEQRIQPGQLNLMTSGRGISHSEESPAGSIDPLHGAQLWIALPDTVRHGEPGFEHHPRLPVVRHDSAQVTLIVGEALGERSPSRTYTPLVGMDVTVNDATECKLPLQDRFEHCVLVLEGSAQVGEDEAALVPGTLLYLGCGRDWLRLRTHAPARLLLLGGAPFPETMLMWWNFVARSKAELTQACRDWNGGAPYFGMVRGYDGAPLKAPLPPW
jgi:redox-sensitive bicupin YhaK (pirin superfamily)